MNIYVLDPQYNMIGIVDGYSSVIWTRRYQDAGDFEIYISASKYIIGLLQVDNVLIRDDDDMVCVIEKVTLDTNAESGDYLTVTGRSIESVLDRRIVWSQTTLNATAEAAIRQLLTENAISPENESRKIPSLSLGQANSFSETLEKQITGENLLESIKNICVTYGYGFKITLNNGNLVFDLYKGIDRSTNQNENPFVIFSDNFDNMVSSQYAYDKTNLKNVALVAGEGEGKDRKTQTVGDAAGLYRRETYIDARDVSSNDGEIAEADYNAMLIDRGEESLSGLAETVAFSAEVGNTKLYAYKTHFFVGDIVQVENNFGIAAACRISEVVECEDENGYTCLPTFENWEVL